MTQLFAERAAGRRAIHAKYSLLTWRFETRDLIQDCVRSISVTSWGHMRICPEVHTASRTLQIELHTGEVVQGLQPTEPNRPEEPASLVYSIHDNGSIAVLLYPHASPTKEGVESQKPYIIDLVKDARHIANACGKRRVRRHLKLLRLLSCATRAHVRPTAFTGRLLTKLKATGERYSTIYDSDKQARQQWIAQNVALGVAVIAGLISGSILPFAKEFGGEMKKDLMANPTSNVFVTSLAKFLTLGPLLTFSLVLVIVMLVLSRRMLKRL